MSGEGDAPGVTAQGRGSGVMEDGGGRGDLVVFVLPGQLRDLTGGRSQLPVAAPPTGTVQGAFGALRRISPAVHDRIFTEQGELRPHVNVFVDGADIRWAGGLDAPVRGGSEVVILPAVSGG